MSNDDSPNLVIGPIRLWTLSRLSSPTLDPWWVDEIVCRVAINSSGARLELDGEIPSRNFASLLPELQSLYDTLEGSATLDASDLGLGVSIRALSMGHMEVTTQFWLYGIWNSALQATIRIDQTDLRPMLDQVRAILSEFPVRADRSLL